MSSTHSLFTLAASAVLALATLGAPSSAQARNDVTWSVGVGVPGVVVGATNGYGGPVYYSPPQPPVYISSPPPYYAPPPVYYSPPRPHYGPPPVYYAPPSHHHRPHHNHNHNHNYRQRPGHGAALPGHG